MEISTHLFTAIQQTNFHRNYDNYQSLPHPTTNYQILPSSKNRTNPFLPSYLTHLIFPKKYSFISSCCSCPPSTPPTHPLKLPYPIPFSACPLYPSLHNLTHNHTNNRIYNHSLTLTCQSLLNSY